MFPVYEEKKENLHLHSRIARHESPHLHNSVEFIYLTEGCLELGMGQELFHMEEGDFAVLFPEVIPLSGLLPSRQTARKAVLFLTDIFF